MGEILIRGFLKDIKEFFGNIFVGHSTAKSFSPYTTPLIIKETLKLRKINFVCSIAEAHQEKNLEENWGVLDFLEKMGF